MFDGSKVALFIGERLVVVRRDEKPGLRWPGWLDFPGGGREGTESPEETLLREVEEEIGLRLDPAELRWSRAFPAAHDPAKVVWYFVAALPEGAETGIAFGDEGQGWEIMLVADFLSRTDAIPQLQDRLRIWMSER